MSLLFFLTGLGILILTRNLNLADPKITDPNFLMPHSVLIILVIEFSISIY